MTEKFSKENLLKAIEAANARVVISSGAVETKEFTAVMNGADGCGRENAVEYIKAFSGESLFVRYESVSERYGPKCALGVLLGALEDAKKNFILYLQVAEKDVERVKADFETVCSYRKDALEYMFWSFEDDGFVLQLRDNRAFGTIDFMKIYPDGKGVIVASSDYRFEKTEFFVPEKILHPLCEAVDERVRKILSEGEMIREDDRCFMKAFEMTYGFAWLGYSRKEGYACRDYVFEKSFPEYLERIMRLEVVKERFVKVKRGGFLE